MVTKRCFAPLERGKTFSNRAFYKHLAPNGAKKQQCSVAPSKLNPKILICHGSSSSVTEMFLGDDKWKMKNQKWKLSSVFQLADSALRTDRNVCPTVRRAILPPGFQA